MTSITNAVAFAIDVRLSRTIATDVSPTPVRRPRMPRSAERTATSVNHELREMKKQLRICINGRLDRLPGRDGRIHGVPITAGGKCADCVEIHRKSRGGGGGRTP